MPPAIDIPTLITWLGWGGSIAFMLAALFGVLVAISWTWRMLSILKRPWG